MRSRGALTLASCAAFRMSGQFTTRHIAGATAAARGVEPPASALSTTRLTAFWVVPHSSAARGNSDLAYAEMKFIRSLADRNRAPRVVKLVTVGTITVTARRPSPPGGTTGRGDG
jgi:hypothetical protein